jgi:hypothetical protein
VRNSRRDFAGQAGRFDGMWRRDRERQLFLYLPVMSGAPKEMERTPSADQATSQESRVSIVPATAAWPPTGAVVIT